MLTKNKYTSLKIAVLFLVFLADGVYTFKQFYGKPLDGDIVPIVLPATYYQKVLQAPFGFQVALHHEHYAATNRYFCHATMRVWFLNVYHFIAPLFNDKVTALYTLSALFSTLVYLLFLWVTARAVLANESKNKLHFWAVVVLTLPFIQANGMSHIALMDNAITYTFFYAFPFVLLLFYFFPFYKKLAFYTEIKFSPFQHIAWIILAIYLAFGGTLIQPLVILLGGAFGLSFFWKFIVQSKQSTTKHAFNFLSKDLSLHFLFFFFLCVYSYYISLFNSENPTEMPDLAQRYFLWCKGIYVQFFTQPAYLLFLLLFAFNNLMLRNTKLHEKSVRILHAAKYVLLFCLIYLLILPFGGYRSYRPYIVRSDLLIPINYCLIFYAVYTTYLSFVFTTKKAYLLFPICLLFIFQIADLPHFHDNACEKFQLRQFEKNTNDTLILKNDCRVLQWTNEFSQFHANDISKMLYKWKISKKPIYYEQR